MKKLLFLVLTLFIIGNTVNSQTFTYSLNTSVTPINNGGAQFDNWDGYWEHDNGNDAWDGTGIGEGAPGGISIIDDFYRIQDCGNPENYGYPSDNGNRKVYGYMDLADFGGTSTILDDGATIHVVARLATDGLLDTLYPQSSLYLSGTVPATGDGYLLHNGGVGNFGIEAGDAWISFVLRTENDTSYEDGVIVPKVNGLQMNPLIGNAAAGFGSADGTPNIIELDPTVWHDFWITIKKDATNTGTHEVSVSVDGAPAEIFIVTASNLDHWVNRNTLFMGCGATDQSGAIDIKAFDFAPGLLEPPAMPVAHWACEGDATDEYGTSDGTLINGDTSSYVEGLVGQALDLIDLRYIEVPNNDIIDFDTNSFSISFLVKIPDFTGKREFMFKGNNDDAVDGHWYSIALSYNTLTIYIDDSLSKTQFENPNIDQVMVAGEWNHIVAIRDREEDKLFLYINGNKHSSWEDLTDGSISSSLPLRIGTNSKTEASVERQMDEIQLYNVALSPEEISSLYNSYFPVEVPDNVVAYWKLDGDATDVRETSNGTLMGGADTNYVEGLDGQALDLSKGTDPTYIEVADNSVINLDTSTFTYSLLLNVPDFASNREIIFKGNNDDAVDGHWYAIALIENTLRFFVDDKITMTNLDFAEAYLHLYDNTWNHIAAIRDRSQDSIFLYINQRMVGSLKDDTEESIGSTLPLIIGAGGNKDVKFDGMLDEVRLYNEAVSLVDLKSLSRDYGIDPKYIESTNANLGAITIIPTTTLNPAFNKDVTEYTAVLPEGTETVRVNALPADFKSTIAGTGEYDISSGSVTAEIVVTAENGTNVKTYTINFTITGIDNIFGKGSKVIYNPIENCLIFENIDNISRVEIYNLAGMKLIEKNNVSERMSLNSANLKGNAVFFVRIITENEYGVMKFVK